MILTLHRDHFLLDSRCHTSGKMTVKSSRTFGYFGGEYDATDRFLNNVNVRFWHVVDEKKPV